MRQPKREKKTKPTEWNEILEQKEKYALPLNLQVNFQRLTQLFGRSLYIKYFVKNVD